MKKINIIIVTIMSMILFNMNVNAQVPTASSNTTYQECIRFANVFKTISNTEKSYHYKYCYRATCSSGVYNKANMISNSAYRCQNGNGTPYVKVTSDGCKSYTGSCSKSLEGSAAFCTKVEFVDCTKNKDGSSYGTTTAAPTTTRRSTTKKVTTTTKKVIKTTKKTTTRKKNTTTKVIIPVTSKTTTKIVTTTKKLNSNTRIKKLMINGKNVKYNNENSLDLKVPYGINNIDVSVELEDASATYVVNGNKNISDDNHVITITVTAVDGTKRDVTLKIIRYSMENSECNLANIYIEGYDLDFSKSIYEYTLSLPKKVKSLDLEIVPVDEEHATYEIEGNSKLKNRSEVKVIVTAENGTECTYTINIKKNSNTWKYVLLIILLLGALGTSVYFLFKYLKKSKGKYKYE